jgi:hypothetical protein
MKYEIAFDYFYQRLEPLKEAEMTQLLHVIKQSRMGQQLIFEDFGHISFDDDDTRKRFGHVESTNGFDRKKSNCIIFDLPISDQNHNRYNKLFLYSYSSKIATYYGYVMLNIEKNHSCQIADIYGDSTDILVSLNKSVISFNHMDTWEAMLKQAREFKASLKKNKETEAA